jgi:hypothetical protein
MGQIDMSRKHSAGKGDSYRKVDLKKYGENYDAIFGKNKNDTSTRQGISRRIRRPKKQSTK